MTADPYRIGFGQDGLLAPRSIARVVSGWAVSVKGLVQRENKMTEIHGFKIAEHTREAPLKPRPTKERAKTCPGCGRPMEGDGISFACGDDVFAILCTKCTQSALKLLGDWSQTIYGAAPRAH